jgi:hypothetical protein
MAGGPPGGHGGHGLKHGHDHGHFPEEEILKEVGSRAYSLKKFEKDNIKKIEKALKSGEELSHKELHEYQHYLEHLSHELKEILQDEHGEHIHNLQLEKDLRKVAQLLGQVSSVLDRH